MNPMIHIWPILFTCVRECFGNPLKLVAYQTVSQLYLKLFRSACVLAIVTYCMCGFSFVIELLPQCSHLSERMGIKWHAQFVWEVIIVPLVTALLSPTYIIGYLMRTFE